MARRTYQQYCPLAHALDLVGERWTLLIVRELQLGPRRFSDLQRGLPGLNPNLLSERLRALEALDIVSKQWLPPPARIQAYTLTPSGQQLNEALIPLSLWGMQYLPAQIPGEGFLGAVPAMVALQLLFKPSLTQEETLSAEIHIEPDSFRLHLSSVRLQVEQGFLQDAPLVLYTEPKALLGLASGVLTVGVAQESNVLQIARGSSEPAERLFAQFALPNTSQ